MAIPKPPTTLFISGFIMQFFMFGMWSCLYAYTPELYPTRARSLGAGMASAFGRVGAISGPIVVGYIIGGVGDVGVFTLGAASFAAAAFIVLTLGIETRGRTLEEIVRDEEKAFVAPAAISLPDDWEQLILAPLCGSRPMA